MGRKRGPLWAVAVGALALAVGTVGVIAATTASAATSGRSAVYGGGPFYSGGQSVMDTLRSSGFTTVILWTIHVHGNGDLYFNDTLIVSNGTYVGDPGWTSRLATLRQAPTSVNRIEVSVGSAGVDDWGTIASLMNSGGTGSGSIVYRNFQALRAATGADALNDDDEGSYNTGATVTFANLAHSIGYAHFTFAPFTNSGFWAGVKSSLGSLVDRVYLQDYAGGSGNDPAAWNSALGMTVDPGLWSRNGSGCSDGDSPGQVQSQMSAWHASAGIVGGFMWLYDDIQACSAQGTPAQYANAINTATGGGGGGGGGGGTITGIAGKCVDVSGGSTANGTKIQLWTCNGTASQAWSLQGGALRALGKCMDVTFSGTTNGTKVQLWDCNGTGAQLWQPRSDGSLFNPNSGKCLDDPGSSTADGTQLIIWTCHGGANQTWHLN